MAADEGRLYAFGTATSIDVKVGSCRRPTEPLVRDRTDSNPPVLG